MTDRMWNPTLVQDGCNSTCCEARQSDQRTFDDTDEVHREYKVFNKTDFSSDAIILSSGQVILLLFGFIQSLLLPKYLSTEDYGHLQIFLLYCTYVGILHFGFADGILLRWAGKDLIDVGKEFKFALTFLFLEQIAVLLILAVCGLILFDIFPDIVFYVLIYAIVINLTTFFVVTAQAIKDFKLLSMVNAVQGLLYLVLILLFFNLNLLDYSTTIFITIFSSLAALFALAFSFRNRLRATQDRREDSLSISSLWEYGIENVRIGFFVLLGNIIVVVFFSMDRFLVSSFFSIENFAEYSFAVTLSSIFYIFVGSVSQVLFPHLSGSHSQLQKNLYKTTKKILIISWAAALIILYIIVDAFVSSYLPQYSASIPLLQIRLSAICLGSIIQILHITFFKLYNKQRQYFLYGLIALAFLIAFNTLAMKFVGTLSSIAIATLISFMFWYMLNEFELRASIQTTKKEIFEDLLAICCYIIAFTLSISISNVKIFVLIIYTIFFILITYTFFNGYIKILWDSHKSSK